ncbi:expansin EXLX1 family cellulose-binding protein [Sphaerisporangium fuscum]|uniref:expansin EXLX1 family cellulose-binding protein n=1 Tax=Sphaerisporangium fuscum TaxID=2835868 RepID=UPI001BDD0606|nr:expansin EXLX1 family cellulose-binding protein [Sphaerisporangium fuscum]
MNTDRRQRLAWGVSMATALALLALGARAGKDAACAATGAGASGLRRHDDAWPGGGDCSLAGAVIGDLVAAVSTEEYAGSAACGAYLDVSGPQGTVRVQVTGRCETCDPGELDLSRSAFARVAGPVGRLVRVTYHTVRNPEVAQPVGFRLKRGSSARWLAIQAVDHGNPLRRLEILRSGHWQALSRRSDNYWVAAEGAGPGPYTVRLTDVYGQRLVVGGLLLAPGDLQRTSRRLYRTGQPPAARMATPPSSPAAHVPPPPSSPAAGTPGKGVEGASAHSARHEAGRVPGRGPARASSSKEAGPRPSASRGGASASRGGASGEPPASPSPTPEKSGSAVSGHDGAEGPPLAALPSARPFFC